MATEKTFTEEAAAPGTSAAFDYQYHYFLYRLFNMKKGQSIGLEMKDDVHSDQENDVQLLFQVKHTIQKQLAGNPIALRELDPDLWKTLHNWARIISDPRDSRSKVKDQLSFVKRTEFHLVSNKSSSKRNDFAKKLINYSEFSSPDNLFLVTERIAALKKSCSDKVIVSHIDTVIKLDKKVQLEFFKRIHFQLEETDLITKIKDTLEERWIMPADVDNIYQRLSTLIRDEIYTSILDGTLKAINFTAFRDKYRRVINTAAKKGLSKLTCEPPLPDDLHSQTFIKQLIAIEDVCESDEELITHFSTQKVRLARSLEVWVQGGEVVSDEVTDLHKDVIARWHNRHRRAYRRCQEHEVNERAQEIVDDLREEKFNLGDDELTIEQSNGELYVLSDDNAIGWHRDWKKL